jgi:group I intron endonuclease
MIKGIKMSESIYCVYKHTSPSGKSYIGQTNNYQKRCVRHRANAERSVFGAAIKKHGWDNFTHEILKENLTIDEANKFEALLIEENNTIAPNGYNIQSGGKNCIMHKDTRAKISAIHKGKTLTPEHLEKLRIANTGRVPSKETMAKIAAKNIGRTVSESQKIKQSFAMKGRKLTNEHKKAISEGGKGKVISQLTRDRISSANMGREVSESHKNAVAIANSERVIKDETRLKMSTAKKGVKQSPEHIALRIAKTTETRRLNKIARQSRDRKEFEARCASMFNNEPFQLMLII